MAWVTSCPLVAGKVASPRTGLVRGRGFVVSSIRMSRITAVILTALAVAGSALAAPPPPQHGTRPARPSKPFLSVAPARVPRGGAVTVSGGGCEAGDSASILSAAFPHATGRVLGTIKTTATANGRFRARARIPATTKRGRYPVSARCNGVGLSVLAWFRIV